MWAECSKFITTYPLVPVITHQVQFMPASHHAGLSSSHKSAEKPTPSQQPYLTDSPTFHLPILRCWKCTSAHPPAHHRLMTKPTHHCFNTTDLQRAQARQIAQRRQIKVPGTVCTHMPQPQVLELRKCAEPLRYWMEGLLVSIDPGTWQVQGMQAELVCWPCCDASWRLQL